MKQEIRRDGMAERDVYMVYVSGSVLVKELEFYRSQGGFEEDWGINWSPVVATSVEDARERGRKLLVTSRIIKKERFLKMKHEDFPVPGYEFMNNPATEDQKNTILALTRELQIPIDENGRWPDPFSKWDAYRMIDALSKLLQKQD